MILNDLNKKVTGKFVQEIIIEDDGGEDIAYIFPDTTEFISIIKRNLVRQSFSSKNDAKA
jgi:hypothetical protein